MHEPSENVALAALSISRQSFGIGPRYGGGGGSGGGGAAETDATGGGGSAAGGAVGTSAIALSFGGGLALSTGATTAGSCGAQTASANGAPATNAKSPSAETRAARCTATEDHPSRHAVIFAPLYRGIQVAPTSVAG